MAEREIKVRGETWRSCSTHFNEAFTSGEKLESATKSNIECNSGISKDFWCHKSMYYYIWIYTFFPCSYNLYFYCSLWWSDDCVEEMLCRIQKIFLFCWTNCLQKSVISSVYTSCICMSALWFHCCVTSLETVNTINTHNHLRRSTRCHPKRRVLRSMCSF